MPLNSLEVHWSLDGSTFVDQAPQFSWTTQFRIEYCTVCADKKRSNQLLGFCGLKGQLQLKFIV